MDDLELQAALLLPSSLAVLPAVRQFVVASCERVLEGSEADALADFVAQLVADSIDTRGVGALEIEIRRSTTHLSVTVRDPTTARDIASTTYRAHRVAVDRVGTSEPWQLDREAGATAVWLEIGREAG